VIVLDEPWASEYKDAPQYTMSFVVLYTRSFRPVQANTMGMMLQSGKRISIERLLIISCTRFTT
jgi:hypothetical protein